MNIELKSKFPAWVNDNEFGKYDLCLSNDIDSLLSCMYLQHIKGYQINYFYDFRSIYKAKYTGKKTVGVDIALESGMTWDNHIVKINPNDHINPLTANVNALNGIHQGNYYTKYCGSTLLQILSYYDIALPKSREGKLILLAIDSSFKGFYSEFFKETNVRWLEQLELYDLIDLLHTTLQDEFHEIKKKYNLDKQISVNQNGKLHTNIDLAAMQGFFDFPLDLPAETFTLTHQFAKVDRFELKKDKEYSKNDIHRLFSFALTHKYKGKFTAGCRAVV